MVSGESAGAYPSSNRAKAGNTQGYQSITTHTLTHTYFLTSLRRFRGGLDGWLLWLKFPCSSEDDSHWQTEVMKSTTVFAYQLKSHTSIKTWLPGAGNSSCGTTEMPVFTIVTEMFLQLFVWFPQILVQMLIFPQGWMRTTRSTRSFPGLRSSLTL